MLITAHAFGAAADMLADVAPVHVIEDLRDESLFLQFGDLTGLDGVQGRYCDASRASRRRTVICWAIAAELHMPVIDRALDMIGGQQ
jgi:hypothetical protein